MKTIFTILLSFLFAVCLTAQNIEIKGPAGSQNFGNSVTALSNGNYVVTDPNYDEGTTQNVGAVYLYNGKTHQVISVLKGGTANCYVGNGGIVAINNGNFVVISPNWINGSVVNAGAVTWINGTTGLNDVVSSSNSIVGSINYDNVGSNGVVALSNGNYVIASPAWDNGALANAGAVTWGDGTNGSSGVVSSSNSMVGGSANDQIGNYKIIPLTNGNYVIQSYTWRNGALTNAGAVTWCNGATGTFGTVSISNSLVGSSASDYVGFNQVLALPNGNYVVSSSYWRNGGISTAGAITLCNGVTGTSGPITTSNSLVGSSVNDYVGGGGLTALSNGNYVVASPSWDNGAIANAGAVTWCNGSTGLVGTINSSNSLVGNQNADQVGYTAAVALNNGNYVVNSPYWDNGAIQNVGAVTWCDGSTGTSGSVSTNNSLIGSVTNDYVGLGITAALSNGNYVANSYYWNNGAKINVGAVTFCNGTTGTIGVVSANNSLIGSSTSDQVGNTGVTALSNGNYVVNSYIWDNGTIVNAGAATWCNGNTGRIGEINASNSLVGSMSSDVVGSGSIFAAGDGSYYVISPSWDNGSKANSGSVTWGKSDGSTVGEISECNSVLGISAGGGSNMRAAYNDSLNYLIVGRRSDTAITIFVNKTKEITEQPDDKGVYAGEATFSCNASDTNLNYQWQTDFGIGWMNLSNAGPYSGVNTKTLKVENVSMSNNDNQLFRCVISGYCFLDTTKVAHLYVWGTSLTKIQNNAIKVYPNPASNQIQIKADEAYAGSTYTIVDQIGRVVLTGTLQGIESTVDLSNLSAGIYTLTVGEDLKQSISVIR